MAKQMTQAIVGLLGIYFLIETISNLARSTHGISYEATFFDKLIVFQQPIILSIAAVLGIRYRDSIATWLNKNASSDEPTNVNMNKMECLEHLREHLRVRSLLLTFARRNIYGQVLRLDISGTKEGIPNEITSRSVSGRTTRCGVKSGTLLLTLRCAAEACSR